MHHCQVNSKYIRPAPGHYLPLPRWAPLTAIRRLVLTLSRVVWQIICRVVRSEELSGLPRTTCFEVCLAIDSANLIGWHDQWRWLNQWKWRWRRTDLHVSQHKRGRGGGWHLTEKVKSIKNWGVQILTAECCSNSGTHSYFVATEVFYKSVPFFSIMKPWR